MPSREVLTNIVLLFFCPFCVGSTRKRFEDEELSISRRFIFDSNHQFTGWSSWQQYAACSTLCVSGYEKQTKECCDTGDNRLCYNIPWDQLKSSIGTCPNDGQWGVWGTWSVCSVTCGHGDKQRVRSCAFDQNRPRGKDCPARGGSETQSCSKLDCPVDGVWLVWSTWTACSVTCGGGIENRHRNCHFPTDVPKGANCAGKSAQQQFCNTNSCPVDGVWEAWSQWTTCTVTCGGGVQNRSRNCNFIVGAPHGNDCSGESVQQQSCLTEKCPVDGFWKQWTNWSSCSATCNLGRTSRTRICTYVADAPHGNACQGKHTEAKFCRDKLCAVDGIWSQWTSWGTCSVTCGFDGTSTRQRLCVYRIPGAPHGKNCTGDSLQHQTCGNRNNTQCAGFKCYACDTTSPEECVALKRETTCHEPYCINELTNTMDGKRLLSRRCGTKSECHNDWWQATSDMNQCVSYDVNQTISDYIHCTFCCVDELCNDNIVPTRKSLYIDN